MKEHPYGIIDPSKIPEIADKILDEFFQITEQLKIKACLAFGLCLGFVRDGEYLEGDNDLDVIAVCDKEDRDKLVSLLERSEFNQGRTFRHKGYDNTHFHKNKILVDIHFREVEGSYSNFESVQYKKKTYFVPYPVEKYLSLCYSNWKIKEDQTNNYYG